MAFYRVDCDYEILVADDTMSRHLRFERISTGYSFAHAFTVSQAIDMLASRQYRMVCLDHDFGTFDDGRTICRWLSENRMCCPERVLIHSQNPIGAEEMKNILADIRGIKIAVVPYRGEP